MERRDYLNYLAGQYIAIGVNDPKKYPKAPFLAKKQEHSGFGVDDESLARWAKMFATVKSSD